MRVVALLFVAMGLLACAERPTSSLPEAEAEALVDVQRLVPDLVVNLRYFGTNNFVGAHIDGYRANKCLLQAPVAKALAAVELELRATSKRLVIYDCYRPKRAVAHFMRWARDLDDQSTKATYYPNLDKSVLVPDYIASESGHSRADTVDLGMMHCRDVTMPETCEQLDFGTPFDFFDPRANTDSDKVSAVARQHRQSLVAAMASQGFRNYPMEWWHFTLNNPKRPGPARDEPVQ